MMNAYGEKLLPDSHSSGSISKRVVIGCCTRTWPFRLARLDGIWGLPGFARLQNCFVISRILDGNGRVEEIEGEAAKGDAWINKFSNKPIKQRNRFQVD